MTDKETDMMNVQAVKKKMTKALIDIVPDKIHPELCGECVYKTHCFADYMQEYDLDVLPVVAKKLNRNYVGIEFNKDYAIWAEKRLMLAENDKTIQGYSDGVFWERNTLASQKKQSKKKATTNNGKSDCKYIALAFEETSSNAER